MRADFYVFERLYSPCYDVTLQPTIHPTHARAQCPHPRHSPTRARLTTFYEGARAIIAMHAYRARDSYR